MFYDREVDHENNLHVLWPFRQSVENVMITMRVPSEGKHARWWSVFRIDGEVSQDFPPISQLSPLTLQSLPEHSVHNYTIFIGASLSEPHINGTAVRK